MKKIIKNMFLKIALMVSFLISSQAWAATSCFLVKELDTEGFIIHQGDSESRHSPCSSFKLPLSLMGFDAGIFESAHAPQIQFQEEYRTWNDFWLDRWGQNMTPKLWLENSCVWASQYLTKAMGMGLFQKYVDQFDYGNKDLSGDPEKNNGLTHSWLCSSLQISPMEQLKFLEKIHHQDLELSKDAYDHTKQVMYLDTLPHGWKLYGKTGSGRLPGTDGKPSELQQGWFIGWIEKEGRVILFVNYLADTQKEETYGGLRAKESAIQQLLELFKQ
jgi:beta-lactamase class D OXA-29